MQLKSKRLETQRKPITSPSSSLLEKTPILQNRSNIHHFPFGSQVEVSSDEEGFRGVWFLATVLRPPPAKYSNSLSSNQNAGKVFVEYKNLLAEENGSALLREFVDSKFVRPVPPVDLDVVNFDTNDVVDAYYQDGWWSGVVTEVVEPNSKYKVFFSNPPDEISFGSSELRVHRIWVDGNWVLPPKQSMRDLNFSPGTAVEVNIDPDNSRDAWFPAKVIKQVSDNNFLVEYQSTVEAGLQKVGVDFLHIRPCPPISSNSTFSLLEKVDALCDCRWLSGIITKILADGRYIVYFKRTRKEKELCHKELRLHMDWTNGKWFHSLQDTSMTSKSEKRSGYPSGGNNDIVRSPSEDSVVTRENNGQVRISAVISRRCEKETHTTLSEKADYSSITPINKRNKQTKADSDTISLRPPRGSNDEAVSNATPSHEICKTKANQTQVSDSGTLVDLNSSTSDPQENSILKHSDDSYQPSNSTETMGDDERNPSTRKRGRPPKLRALVSELVDKTPTGSDVVKPVGPLGPIVIGLTHDGKLIESRAESSGPHLESVKVTNDDGKQSVASADRESVESEPQKEGEVTNLKRKRGRPPKLLFHLGSLKTTKAVLESTGDAENKRHDIVDLEGSPERSPSAEEVQKSIAVVERLFEPVAVTEQLPISTSTPTGDSLMTRVSLISDHFKRAGMSMGKRSTSRRQVRKHRKIPIAAAAMEPANTFILRGKKLKSINQAGVSTEDAVANFRGRAVEDPGNGVGRDVGTVVTKVTNNASDDDRPLSAWLEGAHSPSATDARPSLAGTAGQIVDTGEMRDENDTPPCVQSKEKGDETSAGNGSRDSDTSKRQGETPIPCNAIVPRENQELPLVKNSFVWSDEASAGHASRDNGATKKQDETPVQSTKRQDETPIQSTAIVPRENQELPFVKNSPIWQMIESMEVLKRIPQDPHFRPLYNCKEECREGLAIGSMVTFTSLAERISRAHFEDPKSQLDGYLEALVDLEELGFNVVPVRELLNKLLSIKRSYEEAQNTAREVEGQIVERKQEKSKIEDEISVLEKRIAELKEKQALVVLKKERKDAEITLLQSSVEAIERGRVKSQEEFEKVTASLR